MPAPANWQRRRKKERANLNFVFAPGVVYPAEKGIGNKSEFILALITTRGRYFLLLLLLCSQLVIIRRSELLGPIKRLEEDKSGSLTYGAN